MERINTSNGIHTQGLQQQQRTPGSDITIPDGTGGCMPRLKEIPKRLANFLLCRTTIPAATPQQGRTIIEADASISTARNNGNPVIVLASTSLPISDNFDDGALSAAITSVPSSHPAASETGRVSTSLVATGKFKAPEHSTAIQDKITFTHGILVQRKTSSSNLSTQPSSSTKVNKGNLLKHVSFATQNETTFSDANFPSSLNELIGKENESAVIDLSASDSLHDEVEETVTKIEQSISPAATNSHTGHTMTAPSTEDGSLTAHNLQAAKTKLKPPTETAASSSRSQITTSTQDRLVKKSVPPAPILPKSPANIPQVSSAEMKRWIADTLEAIGKIPNLGTTEKVDGFNTALRKLRYLPKACRAMPAAKLARQVWRLPPNEKGKAVMAMMEVTAGLDIIDQIEPLEGLVVPVLELGDTGARTNLDKMLGMAEKFRPEYRTRLTGLLKQWINTEPHMQQAEIKQAVYLHKIAKINYQAAPDSGWSNEVARAVENLEQALTHTIARIGIENNKDILGKFDDALHAIGILHQKSHQTPARLAKLAEQVWRLPADDRVSRFDDVIAMSTGFPKQDRIDTFVSLSLSVFNDKKTVWSALLLKLRSITGDFSQSDMGTAMSKVKLALMAQNSEPKFVQTAYLGRISRYALQAPTAADKDLVQSQKRVIDRPFLPEELVEKVSSHSGINELSAMALGNKSFNRIIGSHLIVAQAGRIASRPLTERTSRFDLLLLKIVENVSTNANQCDELCALTDQMGHLPLDDRLAKFDEIFAIGTSLPNKFASRILERLVAQILGMPGNRMIAAPVMLDCFDKILEAGLRLDKEHQGGVLAALAQKITWLPARDRFGRDNGAMVRFNRIFSASRHLTESRYQVLAALAGGIGRLPVERHSAMIGMLFDTRKSLSIEHQAELLADLADPICSLREPSAWLNKLWDTILALGSEQYACPLEALLGAVEALEEELQSVWAQKIFETGWPLPREQWSSIWPQWTGNQEEREGLFIAMMNVLEEHAKDIKGPYYARLICEKAAELGAIGPDEINDAVDSCLSAARDEDGCSII